MLREGAESLREGDASLRAGGGSYHWGVERKAGNRAGMRYGRLVGAPR